MKQFKALTTRMPSVFFLEYKQTYVVWKEQAKKNNQEYHEKERVTRRGLGIADIKVHNKASMIKYYDIDNSSETEWKAWNQIHPHVKFIMNKVCIMSFRKGSISNHTGKKDKLFKKQ